MEPLVKKIEGSKHGKHVVGINMPGYEGQMGTMQRADDTTVVLGKESSFVYLRDELDHFENASGSSAGEEKFEVLRLGNWNLEYYDVPGRSVREGMKMVGICYGNSVQEGSYGMEVDRIKNRIGDWSIPYNLYSEAIMIKAYLLSIIMCTMTVVPIDNENAQEVMSILCKFIWNGQDGLERGTLEGSELAGGIGVPNVVVEQAVIVIDQLQRLGSNFEDVQPLKGLCIYWFGLLMRPIAQELTGDKFVHALNVPEGLLIVKGILLEYGTRSKIWNFGTEKREYDEVLVQERCVAGMEKYKHSVWDQVWLSLGQIRSAKSGTMIYGYIHEMLPTTEYLLKCKVVKKLEVCSDCNKPGTLERIYMEYKGCRAEGEGLKGDLILLIPDVVMDEGLSKYMCNDAVDPNV